MPIISGGGSSSGGGAVTRLFDQTLGADAATIDTGAAGVPQTSNHLQIVCLLRSARAAIALDVLAFQFNADTGANYNSSFVFTTGAGAPTAVGNQSLAATGIYAECPAATATAGLFAAITINVPSYRATVALKSVTMLNAYAKALSSNNIPTLATGGHWNNAAAITRVAVVSPVGANLLAGSRMTIYGIT